MGTNFAITTLATDSNGRHPSVVSAAVAWNANADRERAFARARRHSAVVRWLKMLLPICAVIVMSSYGLFMQRSITINDGSGKLELGPIAFSSDVLTMHNPRYEGYSKDGSRFTVAALTAEQDVGREKPIRLKTIEGSIVQPNKTTTTLQAAAGLFDTEANELELLDAIEITSSDGMVARLTRAKVFMKDSKIVSDDPVAVEMPTGTLRGNSMVLLQKTRELTFAGDVTARLNPQSRPSEAAGKAARSQSISGLIGSGSAPVDVTAPMLTIDDASKRALFTGNVRIEQEGSILTARELAVAYDGGTAPDGGGAPPVPGTAAAGRVKEIIARGDVVMTRDGDRVTSAAAAFDMAAETSVLTGGVTFTSGPDRQAAADRAELDFKADTALLTGDVSVSQGANILTGRRLLVDRANGTMRLSAPPEPAAVPGRITARFQQPDGRPSPQQAAPDGDASGWRFRTNPNAPIEIEADVLDVDDRARTATFRGDVHVVQGEFSMRTVELVATYSGQAGAGLLQPTDPGASTPTVQLQRIKANKKVVVTSDDDQSATGDWAEFDIKTSTVVLGGDVTLTQGRNVVRGPRLVIDTTTGLSRMETSRTKGAETAKAAPVPSTGYRTPEHGANAPSAKGWPAGACGGRMCAVFYPSDVEALAARRKAKDSAPSRNRQRDTGSPPQPRAQGEAASSWSSTTVPAGGAE